MFEIVVLGTDALIYLLLAAIFAFILYARRHADLRQQWHAVIGRPMAMGALVVLLAYILTGVLDSLHFRPALEEAEGQSEVHYSAEVISVLDILMGPVRTQVEKTYSAPFAAHLFAKETVLGADGVQRREYPRLLHGGAHLVDPAAERAGDIRARGLRALGQTLVFGAIWLLITVFAQARKLQIGVPAALGRVLRGKTDLPWRTALGMVSLLALMICLAIQLAPYYHIFGTDKVGQDVFYQAVKSVRTGLVIGTVTTLVMLPFAVALGIMAGYFRGWVDDVIQYIYSTLNSIPGVLLIAAAVLMLQVYMANHPDQFATTAERADARLLFLCLILGVTSWTGLCRLLRGEALKLREVDFIQAAGAFGVAHANIIARHILPNVMHIVLISVVLDFSGLVLAEAVLSYVGVGVDPITHSWGNMINSARLEMAREPIVWWSLFAAFSFMFALVLAANLFADAVRDAFDPRLRGR